jgi:hypothetical protein
MFLPTQEDVPLLGENPALPDPATLVTIPGRP